MLSDQQDTVAGMHLGPLSFYQWSLRSVHCTQNKSKKAQVVNQPGRNRDFPQVSEQTAQHQPSFDLICWENQRRMEFHCFPTVPDFAKISGNHQASVPELRYSSLTDAIFICWGGGRGEPERGSLEDW